MSSLVICLANIVLVTDFEVVSIGFMRVSISFKSLASYKVVLFHEIIV